MTEKGFTLVELAIVLMIIGLLIGGILRGQELMENARITSTAQQLMAYKGAVVTFQNQYSALAGDISNATRRLSGCTPANSCANGNGDGVLGILNAGQGGFANEPWQAITNDIASENTQFWKHLALARIVSGVNPAASVPEWGVTHPAAQIGGGFFARYSNLVISGRQMVGTILLLRNPISGAWSCGGGVGTGLCAIAPNQAALLDRKIDDGRATTGDLWAISGGWSNGCGMPNSGNQAATGYDETNERTSCDMMFKL